MSANNGHDSRQTTLIRFSNSFRAIDIIYYNATLISLLRLGRGLIGDIFLRSVNSEAPLDLTQPLRSSPLLLPPDIGSIEDVTSEFYRSLEGHMYSTGGLANESILLSFSTSLASLGTTKGSRDAFLIRELRRKVIGTSGFSIWHNALKEG